MAKGTKFTDRYIQSLKAQDKPKEYLEPTPAYRGSFGIRVSKTGTKSFFVYYKGQGGKQRRVTIGSYGGIGLADARKKAYKALADAEQGIDPVADKQQGRTFTTLWKRFSSSREFTHNNRNGQPKSQRTLTELDRKWRRIIEPAWGNKLVKDITRLDIRALIATVPPMQGNALHSVLSVLFTKAVDIGWLELHPMYKMKKPAVSVARDRVLEGDEITDLWKALDDEKVTSAGRDVMKLILLTGQRPGEVMSMRFDEIDEEGNWHQGINKTRSHNVVPLNRQSLEIINARSELGNGIHVFYEPKTETSIKSVHRQKKNANQVMNPKDPWTEHDLRRSARTLMGKIGIAPDIAERVLGHSMGRIQAVYDKYSYLPEKRAALKKLGAEIDRLTGKVKAKEKVVQMRMLNG